MSRKIGVALVATAILIFFDLADAQQSAKVYRIGYLATSRREAPQPFADAFEQGMRDHGYAVGKNLLIEYRFAEGKFDRLPDLAADLVRLNVDVIVTSLNPSIVAAKQATSTIPIVMAFGNDPIGSGLVASLANPGSNLTGLSMDTGEENFGKRLELLKESSGKLSRLAVLFNSANAGHQLYLKNLDLPARNLRLTLIAVACRETGDFENAFKTMTTQNAGGIFFCLAMG